MTVYVFDPASNKPKALTAGSGITLDTTSGSAAILSASGGGSLSGSGTSGQVAYWTSGSVLAGSSSFLWDNSATQLTVTHLSVTSGSMLLGGRRFQLENGSFEVDVTGATSGSFLGFNGSKWVPMMISGGGSTSPLAFKGDLYTYSTIDTRLPVGANGTVLTADSTQATGLKWAVSSGSGGGGISGSGTAGQIAFWDGTSSISGVDNFLLDNFDPTDVGLNFWNGTDGYVNIYGGSFSIQDIKVAGNVVFSITNADNTNGSSNSYVSIQSGGASSGDPVLYLTNLVATWTIGLDNSDGDQLKIGSSDVGSNPIITLNYLTGAGLGFFGHAFAFQQVDGAGLANNVTAGGTTNQIDDFTNLTVYAADAAAIRNAIYQLTRKLKIVDDGLRNYGLLT